MRPTIIPNMPCWLWPKGKDSHGYSEFRGSNGKTLRGHSEIYKAIKGSIPKGLHLDHICRVRHCVNPFHLEPVTPHENSLRGIRAIRTHCGRGHKYTKETMRPRYVPEFGTFHRRCLLCEKIYDKRRTRHAICSTGRTRTS